MNFKALAALLFYAALLGGSVEAAMHPAVFTTPGPITLKADDDFLIALPSNPSTGYTWSLTGTKRNVVAFRGSAYRAPQVSMPGAGGERIFSFQALAAGTATLEFNYARPWEKHTRPAKTAIFIVSVSK